MRDVLAGYRNREQHRSPRVCPNDKSHSINFPLGLKMSDEAFIYLIVAFNTFVQVMLIGRLYFPSGGRRKYFLLAVGIPGLVMLSTRLLVATGMIHGRVADQTAIEQHITNAAGILLIAAPWLVTLAAILDKKRKGWVIQTRRGPKSTE